MIHYQAATAVLSGPIYNRKPEKQQQGPSHKYDGIAVEIAQTCRHKHRHRICTVIKQGDRNTKTHSHHHTNENCVL